MCGAQRLRASASSSAVMSQNGARGAGADGDPEGGVCAVFGHQGAGHVVAGFEQAGQGGACGAVFVSHGFLSFAEDSAGGAAQVTGQFPSPPLFFGCWRSNA